jgi:prepilin-type N-terminal cleavage/methylation domain-containing protein
VINKGFTIIELAVSIAILAIAVVMGVPAFQEARGRAELRAATGEITSILRLARSEAVRTNQVATVQLAQGDCGSATPAAIRVVVGTTVERCVPLADFERRYRSVTTLSSIAVSFSGRGLAISVMQNYAINGRTGGMSRAVTVEASGRVFEGSTG